MFIIFMVIANEILNALAILNTEPEITKQIKYDEIIDNFADIQPRIFFLKWTTLFIITHYYLYVVYSRYLLLY